MCFWYFPSTKGGDLKSFSNPGLETFRDNPVESLVREVCQNSLDAILDNEQPVIVEFKRFNSDYFPGRDELIDSFIKAKLTWENANKKNVKFIENALDYLSKDEISYLRISDFNTCGLEGALLKNNRGTPWSTLIKETGSSNKDGDAGGSFGIGKHAPFLVSDLRTLFYSSYAIDEAKSYVGVSDIMSFEDGEQITIGKGYYTNSHESTAIPNLLNLDPSFQREEYGTDIYVSAFHPNEGWEEKMKEAVLLNFFVTIFENKLIVRINDYEINCHNIKELIDDLDEQKNKKFFDLKHYYDLLINEKTIKKMYPEKHYSNDIIKIVFVPEEAELLIKFGEGLNRRILLTRKNGMRIKEQGHFKSGISFTGLLLMKGKNMNSIFKEMENPAHNDWIPDRYEQAPELAEKIYKDLRNFMRESVYEEFQQTTKDVVDAYGLSDFLPNTNGIDNGNDPRQSLTPSVKDVDLKPIDVFASKNKPKGNTSTVDDNSTGEFDLDYDSEGTRGNEPFEYEEIGSKVNGIGYGEYGIDENTQGTIGQKPKVYYNNREVPIHLRYVATDKKNGKYYFEILPKANVQKGILQFEIIGEQKNEKLRIKNASIENDRSQIDDIKENRIYFFMNQVQFPIKLNVEIDYTYYCAIEVKLYEDQ